jgi:hypothetical protein
VTCDDLGRAKPRELAEELEAAAAARPSLTFVVRKARTAVERILPWKSREWRVPATEGRQRAELARGGQLAQTAAICRIGHLVVVFEKVHELPRRQPVRGRPAGLVLPPRSLSLEQETARRGREQFLARAVVVGVVRLPKAGQRHASGVVEVIVVDGIETYPPRATGRRASAF